MGSISYKRSKFSRFSKHSKYSKVSSRKKLSTSFSKAEMLDYSFLKLMSISELSKETPRNKKEKSDRKFRASLIKLNNNFLISITNFMDSLSHVLVRPESLTLIDLSFNSLDAIDPVFAEFPLLQILLLHGNKIADPNEVSNLIACPVLKKLALHGNQIEKMKNYRFYVLTLLPRLRSLDMSTVTKMDRTISYYLPLTAYELTTPAKPVESNIRRRRRYHRANVEKD